MPLAKLRRSAVAAWVLDLVDADLAEQPVAIGRSADARFC
jgi:hypothetical protein